VIRNLLLAGSENLWLREQATRHSFVRRAVSRFMPGETLDDALRAASELRKSGLSTIVTELGENVTTAEEAQDEARRYLEVLRRVKAAALDCEVSVKLTHLGLDQSIEATLQNLSLILDAAEPLGIRVWVDMEGSAYTERTVDVFRRARERHRNVGLALQSYLRRTRADLESLLPLGPAIRMVKGAYLEPPEIAFQDKAEVDENFFALSTLLLTPEARKAGAWLAAGTHDLQIITRLQTWAANRSVPRDSFEFAMLYGIQRAEQVRLVQSGFRTRVLISYGTQWFPWYMRRLAERPANMLFVARSLFGR
jgi:proline dehydrogenase